MKTFTIYGSSDDLVETSGVPGTDEFNIISSGDHVGTFILGQRIRIEVYYDGVWSFALAQVEEEIRFPDWPIRISQADNGYSTYIEIDVPDNTTFARLEKD